jgi:hypothetical protein
VPRVERIAQPRQHICDRIGQPHRFASPRTAVRLPRRWCLCFTPRNPQRLRFPCALTTARRALPMSQPDFPSKPNHLPGRLHDAWNLALERERAEAQAADAELAQERARTPAQVAAVVLAAGKLRLPFVFHAFCSSCHFAPDLCFADSLLRRSLLRRSLLHFRRTIPVTVTQPGTAAPSRAAARGHGRRSSP